jgi:hypothetical protein
LFFFKAATTQRSTHTITVNVSKETGESIGKFLFTYTDIFFDQLLDYVCNPPKKSDPRCTSQQPKHSSSEKSCGMLVQMYFTIINLLNWFRIS